MEAGIVDQANNGDFSYLRNCCNYLHGLALFQWHTVELNGWHNKNPLEYLALIASEVGEAVNECRGATPTDKLGEELADIICRVLDFAHHQGIPIEDEVYKKMVHTRMNKPPEHKVK